MIELNDKNSNYVSEVRRFISDPGIEPHLGESLAQFETRKNLARQMAELQLKSYLQGIVDHNGGGKYTLKDNTLCPII